MNFGTHFDAPFGVNIETQTLKNKNFRKVLHTSPNMQLVLMSLAPNEEIGAEAHPYITQFFRAEKGTGIALIDNKEYSLSDGDIVVIPPGCQHNIINLSDKERLQLYTIYSPPQHPIGTVHKYKQD